MLFVLDQFWNICALRVFRALDFHRAEIVFGECERRRAATEHTHDLAIGLDDIEAEQRADQVDCVSWTLTADDWNSADVKLIDVRNVKIRRLKPDSLTQMIDTFGCRSQIEVVDNCVEVGY